MMQQFNQEVMERLVKEQEFNELAKVANRHYRAYRRIKWKGQVYQINESVRMKIEEQYRIGVIKRILSIRAFNDNSELPLLCLNWYITKEDLGDKYSKYQNSFSVYELFLSDQTDYIPIMNIVGGVRVLNLKEFDSVIDEDEGEQNNIFFMRCSYRNETMTPSPEELESVCLCHMPHNPDLIYIFCEECKKWFHMECVHLTEEEAKDIEQYVCPNC